MTQSAAEYRKIIAELRSPSAWSWFAYCLALFTFLYAVVTIGRSNAGAHLLIASLFLAVLGSGLWALGTDLAKDYFLDETELKYRRIAAILFGAGAFAVACGVLETPLPVEPSSTAQFEWKKAAADYFNNATAKSLSSFISALGFAAVFSALTAELTGGWKFNRNITPTEYKVDRYELKHTMFGCLKYVYFKNSEGKLIRISTNLSLTNSVLLNSQLLASRVTAGDRILVIESGDHRAIVEIL